MKRRDFLKTSGSFVVVASIGACGGGGDAGPDANQTGLFAFSQGVASGDPRETSVMLWTRVESTGSDTADVAVTVQVSTSEDFSSPVVSQDVTASADSDFTLRLLVEGLTADTVYFYRFLAGPGQDASETGRTWTAPTSTADTPVTLAWVSCQDYEAGFHAAYRQMITDDLAAAAADQIRAVVHLGDFIYETRGAQFSRPVDNNFNYPTLTDRDGNPRVIEAFPSGGGNGGGYNYAKTLDDYRHQYKQYLRDPDLRAARARFPFVYTWDDHEFTNDCWQSEANYTDMQSLDEPSQQRKVVANQAWFEFVPAILSDATGVPGVPPEAQDFTPATVSNVMLGDVVNADNLATESNNIAALGTLTLYRSLRLGAHVELVVTDERSYRSDHAIPEETIYGSIYFFDERNVLSKEMLIGMDAGRTANGNSPPTDFHNGTFPNPRIDSPPGSMLGAPQKAWWKATMMGSDATWKLWANEVPLMRMLIKNPGILFFDRLADGDAWDGYHTERTELTTFLRDQSIKNVVALTGDIHAHFAGVIMDDYEAATPTPVMTELIAGGITSNSLFSFYEFPTRTGPAMATRPLITYDATALGGTNPYVNTLNMTFQWGAAASQAMAQNNDIVDAQNNRIDVNPHMVFADSDAQGYGVVKVTATEVTGQLVKMNKPLVDSAAGPGVKYRASFTIPKDTASISAPDITGAAPFPFDTTT